jgi:Na+-driven multidrug efflux pump
MSVLSSRTQRILEAPVLPLLLSLAAPNIGEAAARITFLTADAVFVSWLGSDALAGVAVVFPLFLILQTATASGFGSGVSSAIGRALGAGDHARAAYGVGTLVLLVHLVSRQALVRLWLDAIRLKRAEAAAILGVGVVSAASATLFQVTTFFVAGIVAVLGSSAVAAYGAAVRLELLQYPITFAFGSAVITMVATAAGARDFARAQRAAWTGAAVAAAIGLVFTVIALFGRQWMGLFTSDPAIRDMGALYLLSQAAVFPLTGAGLACYFACLGIGFVGWPFALAALRLVLIVGGAWLALTLTGSAAAAFAMVAVGIATFAIGLLIAMRARFRRLAD